MTNVRTHALFFASLYKQSPKHAFTPGVGLFGKTPNAVLRLQPMSSKEAINMRKYPSSVAFKHLKGWLSSVLTLQQRHTPFIKTSNLNFFPKNMFCHVFHCISFCFHVIMNASLIMLFLLLCLVFVLHQTTQRDSRKNLLEGKKKEEWQNLAEITQWKVLDWRPVWILFSVSSDCMCVCLLAF